MVSDKRPSVDELFEQECASQYGDRWPQIKAKWERERLEAQLAMEQYNGEIGLIRMEQTLGLVAAGDESFRIDAIVATVRRLVAEWEQMTPSSLLKYHNQIEVLFHVTERVGISSFVNHGALPQCWWALLAVRLDESGMYDRLTNQIHRETDAWSARRILKDERSMGGKRRAANDPKTSAKADAFELWKERCAGKHPKLRTNEQFAMECMRRWPALTSIKVICGWCTVWTKEAKSQSAS